MPSVNYNAQLYKNMFSKLLKAIDEHKDETPYEAATEVLGYTGSWMTRLTNEELIVLIREANNQLLDNMRNGHEGKDSSHE